MKKLQVRLFGKLSITCESEDVEGLESTKVQELLCYLLLNRDRPHPRITLASVLWGDVCTTSNSRKYLRNALWRLRSALEGLPGVDKLIVADSDWVELRTGPVLELDAGRFERAYSISLAKAACDMSTSDALDMDRAIRLYSGCLLANWTCDWVVTARDRLHQHYLAMLDRMADYEELKANYIKILALAERLLDSDPAHERSHRRLMRVYLATGDRTNALRQYARCVDALQNELGIEPGPKTRAVLSEICDGKPPVVHLLTPTVHNVQGHPRPTNVA